MSELTILSGNQSFMVKGKDILSLELKLNLTIKGRIYRKIGEHIYEFYIKEGCKGDVIAKEISQLILRDLNIIPEEDAQE